MQRRNFLQLLAAVPFLGWLKPQVDPGIPYCGPVSIDDFVDVHERVHWTDVFFNDLPDYVSTRMIRLDEDFNIVQEMDWCGPQNPYQCLDFNHKPEK